MTRQTGEFYPAFLLVALPTPGLCQNVRRHPLMGMGVCVLAQLAFHSPSPPSITSSVGPHLQQ